MLMTEVEPVPVSLNDIDLFPAEFYRSGEPHAAWRVLRAAAPVWHQHTPDGVEFWSVTRYRDAVEVLRDTQRFSSEYSTMLTVLGEGDSARGTAVHLTDPPRHSQIRGATIPALSMRVMRAQEARIRSRVRHLLKTEIARGRFDFAQCAAQLPMVVAGEMLGIPQSEWAETARWTVASMAPDDPAYSTGDPRSTLWQAHVYLFAMFTDLIEQRRRTPGDDLVSRLTRLTVDGRPATDEQVLINCYAFIMGANPTVPQAASQLVLALADRPGWWQRIRQDGALVDGLVEETLRWSSPVNHLLRRASEEVRIGDQVIPAGGLVAVWLASANRDEEVFSEPYVFDPTRTPNPQIAFGVGAHRCVGNSTARLGLQLLIEELAELVDAVLVTGEVRHLASNFLNGITSLPVVVEPASSRPAARGPE
jgi:cytochrome P450